MQSPPPSDGERPYHRRSRIVRGSDFARAYREGRRARGECLLVVGRPNGLGRTRLGLSVGRRIWRGAVERNRVRRVFREAFRLALPDLPIGLDLVLIPAAPRLEPKLAATQAELVRLARKVERRLREAAPPSGSASEPTPGADSGSTPDARAGASRRRAR